jgi:hypothetical protein
MARYELPESQVLAHIRASDYEDAHSALRARQAEAVRLASNFLTPSADLDALYELVPHFDLFIALLENPNCPQSIINDFLHHPLASLRAAAANSDSTAW